MMISSRMKAFTLIELLIVVAIIAILAAIAVPNFLEAQVRSKVSRAMSDMRTLATGLEAYRLDNNHYPIGASRQDEHIDSPVLLAKLSTPVAYITNPLMRDPFKVQGDVGSNPGNVARYGVVLGYCFANFYSPYSAQYWKDRFTDSKAFPLVNGYPIAGNNGNNFPGPIHWSLTSYGPDRSLQYDDDPSDPDPEWASSVTYMPYDATNGTRSRGDIFRFGP